ncbi:MAG: protein-export chaperone SecB [Candidatus Thiodiazotropha endolucinida]
MPETNESYSRHAIQLELLKVLQLHIETKRADPGDQEEYAKGFTLTAGCGEFNEENKTINVRISASIDSEKADAPFDLLVELLGIFSVDDSRFPLAYIEDWAKRNAPLILYPYVREHVFGLTTRAGFDSVILPLLEVPTYKITSSDESE